MALRLRRGTDAERVTITPQAGELIYVIDTKKVWVGDGLTQGGVPVDSTLGSLSIDDLTDVDTTTAPPQNGEALVWNSVDQEWQPQPVVTFESDPSVNGNLKVNIVGTDSSLLVDGDNNRFLGQLVGDSVGNLYGSVYFNDSSVSLDTIANALNIRNVNAENLNRASDNFRVFDLEGSRLNIDTNPLNATQQLEIIGTDLTNETDIRIQSGARCRLLFYKVDTTQDLSNDTSSYGNIDFRREDSVTNITTGRISGGKDFIYFFQSDQGLSPGAPPVLPYGNFMFYRNGDLGIGTNLPQAKLDVQGDAVVLGTMTAASFKGSVVADDSTVIVDAINSTITAGGFVQFGSYTDAEIAAITPANGMVYYNSTDNRFRGYQNGGWINLDDGTAA